MAEYSTKITIDDLEVIASGSVIVREDETAVFAIASIEIGVSFAKGDKDNDKVSATAAVQGEKRLNLKLLNFENPDGSAYWSRVGHISKRGLHLRLFVHGLTGEKGLTRLVSYQFALDKEGEGGK